MACTTIFGDKSKKKDSPYLILYGEFNKILKFTSVKVKANMVNLKI